MGTGIKTVEKEMLPGGINGWCGDVDAGNGGLVAGQCGIDRETTRVTEAVQDPPVPRILAQGFTLIALIDKKACFLPLPGINKKFHAVFSYSHLPRNFPG